MVEILDTLRFWAPLRA